MPPETNPEWSLSPDFVTLDDLELLRNKVLGTNRVGPSELVRIEFREDAKPLEASAVTIKDPEGVPIATIPLIPNTEGHLVAEGVPRWLGRRSARPFEAQHLSPKDAGHNDELVVVDGARSVERLAARNEVSLRAVLVLALASTDGDASAHDIETVRAANGWAAQQQAARVVVVPLARSATQWREKKRRVIAAYGPAAQVTDLTLPPDEPDEASQSLDGTVLFFTGFSGSGKSTLAREVRNWLVERGRPVTLLDGDIVRQHLSAGLGFSPEDRNTNIRRIGWVAAEIAAHGGVAICSPIAPFEQTRREVRDMVERRGGRFVLVHVDTPLEECERRDRKGLYARARRGEIPDFTGISSPYETPEDPDLRLKTTDAKTSALRDEVLSVLGAIDHDEKDN